MWKIGRIRNFAHRAVAYDPDANKVKIQVVAQALNHSLNGVGEKVWMTVGMKFEDDRLWVGQNAVIIDIDVPEPDVSKPCIYI